MNVKSTHSLWLGALCLVLILAIIPAAYAQGPGDNELTADALVLVNASTDEAMENAVDFIRSRGGSVPATFAPHALLVRLPSEGSAGWTGQAGIVSVYTGQVDATAIAATYGAPAGLAARVWNSWLTSPVPSGPPPGAKLPNDVKLVSPSPAGEIAILGLPSADQTSEYLAGSVQVDLFLPESDGSLDPSSENWSTTRRDQVVSEVTAGITWWAAAATQGGRPSANVSFNISVHDPFNEPAIVATGYEPITRPDNDDYLWIEEIMGRLGYAGQGALTATRHYANDRRTSTGRNWGFVIFVVDSLNDTNDMFSDGSFAYAYINGPYAVMTYGNDGWGINNMEIVIAHEMGHTFGALDEYASSRCSTSDRSGYLNIANTNCENGTPTEDSIMRGSSSQQIAYPSHLASVPVRGMVGWRDSDEDGLYDVVDTSVQLSASRTSGGTYGQPAGYSGTATDIPYDSPTHPDASINTISLAEFRLDSDSWLPATASDGDFDEYSEAFSLATAPLIEGTHTVEIRARNTVGNYSTVFSDTIVVSVAPTGVAASDGAYTDRVRVTWSAVAEASSYEVWRNTSSDTGTATQVAASVSGTSYDDGTAVPKQTYYYWVKARNAYGASAFSGSDTGWRELAAPTGVAASDGAYTDRVRVSWEAVAEASSYEVWRNTSDDTGTATQIAAAVGGTSYDDTSAEAWLTYYYWVKAETPYGTTGFSASDSGSIGQRVYLPIVAR